jgi:hypothetical protein
MKHLFGKIAWGLMIAAISFCLPILATVTLAESTQIRVINYFRHDENSKDQRIAFMYEIVNPFIMTFLN